MPVLAYPPNKSCRVPGEIECMIVAPLLDRVRERDLDVLLAAHLTASEAFRALLLRHALGEAPPHTLIRCQISVSQFRTCDVMSRRAKVILGSWTEPRPSPN